MTQEIRSIHTQLCQILQNHRMILHDLNLDDPEIPAVEHYADLADELAAECEGMYRRHLQGVTPQASTAHHHDRRRALGNPRLRVSGLRGKVRGTGFRNGTI